MTEHETLKEMLRMHNANEPLTQEFANDHYEELNKLWSKGLSSYEVTKMITGRVRARRKHRGILTPLGLEKAKEIN